MPKARVNGIDLHYEIHGAGDPLVLIMGLRRNVEWWYLQIPAFSERFQTIVFDNRGTGRSDKPEKDYSIRLFADDTAGLMEALDIQSAHVVGISMGGYIAQELAINHPDRVRRLILGCTGCGGNRGVPMSPDRMEKFTANKALSPEEILRKDMNLYFSDRFIQENPHKIEAFVEISLRYYQPPDAFFRQLEACLKHDTIDRLGHISSPTLILAGDDDLLVPSENSKILKELISRADLHFFSEHRHCFFIEGAARFNQEVINFLTTTGNSY
jgi:pimeloyl-ACP methyl ester carboxylesterase